MISEKACITANVSFVDTVSNAFVCFHLLDCSYSGVILTGLWPLKAEQLL